MEKKGDLFNQLAIITDLLQKVNIDSTSQTILLELPEEEFYRIYRMVRSKVREAFDEPKETFNVKIGNVNIIFNKNSV